jgi:hypothetical protein
MIFVRKITLPDDEYTGEPITDMKNFTNTVFGEIEIVSRHVYMDQEKLFDEKKTRRPKIS